ncbi:MAG: glycine cleavage system aminomethyltransferase GcvT [Caldicoprobacterales bacterium]|jgi:aminomethyltransferase|nr:glycine cleavage system aminomethyltransferase GcvT [Clostridiales bacterium]
MSELLKTPLYPIYKDYGAKIIDFAGWALPIQFEGIILEHHSVRKSAGLFDVSHMGEIEVKGQDALSYLNYIMTNDVSKLKPNQVQYSVMVNENGGTLDDVLIYCFNEQHYWVIANAANRLKDFKWMQKQAACYEVNISDISDHVAQLALQGPKASEILNSVTEEINNLRFFRFKKSVVANDISCLISRTGYTGEDGFELYCKPEDVVQLWKTLLSVGKKHDLKPAGLGCRDTLRFEAGMHLYGNELNENITPLEAGLNWVVKFDKKDFIGKSALQTQKQKGISRKLIGFEMQEKGIPRGGYEVKKEDKTIGYVTTGYLSPTLNKTLGMALIDAEFFELGNIIEIVIRGKKVPATIVETPFYSKKYKK